MRPHNDREFKIIERLLEGRNYKTIGREFNVSHSRVAQIVRAWPLFFWRRMKVRNSFFKKR